jgi:hypothetical protein
MEGGMLCKHEQALGVHEVKLLPARKEPCEALICSARMLDL